jgi:hypothetical protein
MTEELGLEGSKDGGTPESLFQREETPVKSECVASLAVDDAQAFDDDRKSRRRTADDALAAPAIAVVEALVQDGCLRGVGRQRIERNDATRDRFAVVVDVALSTRRARRTSIRPGVI